MFDIWASGGQGRVATAYGINRDGEIYQGFSTKYWAYALRINAPINRIPVKFKKTSVDATINSKAIQVELCNWGGLRERDGKLYAWPDKYSSVIVPKEQAVFYEHPFRDYNWFQAYTQQQIDSLAELILFHANQDNIPLEYHKDMWDISEQALAGTPGIWTHVSYRSDKSDCHPQPELIQMLKELELKVVNRDRQLLHEPQINH